MCVCLCMSVHAYMSTCLGRHGLVKVSAQNLDSWEPGPRGPEREACSLPAAPQFPPLLAEVFLHHLWNQAPDPVRSLPWEPSSPVPAGVATWDGPGWQEMLEYFSLGESSLDPRVPLPL